MKQNLNIRLEGDILTVGNESVHIGFHSLVHKAIKELMKNEQDKIFELEEALIANGLKNSMLFGERFDNKDKWLTVYGMMIQRLSTRYTGYGIKDANTIKSRDYNTIKYLLERMTRK